MDWHEGWVAEMYVKLESVELEQTQGIRKVPWMTNVLEITFWNLICIKTHSEYFQNSVNIVIHKLHTLQISIEGPYVNIENE